MEKFGKEFRRKHNVKGIVLARRDNCKWIRDTYETMVRGIFAENTIEISFDMIVDAVIDVIELKFDITSKLSIVKAMGSNYKSATFSLAIFSELMKSLGVLFLRVSVFHMLWWTIIGKRQDRKDENQRIFQ